MDKYPLNIFSRYVEDNKSALTGVSVIATIAALFLNLDGLIFGESLRNLQLLLLLFLVLGLVFLTTDSLFWFVNNADSSFAGLITFSLALTIWRLWEFILNNFRDELNGYLLFIFVSFVFVICEFLNHIKKKAEFNIDKKFVGALPKAILHGFVFFSFFYLLNIFLGFYSNFARGKELLATQFIEPLYNPFAWLFATWVAVAEFCVAFFFGKGRTSLWLIIPLFLALGLTPVVILWPAVVDLICVFKTSC